MINNHWKMKDQVASVHVVDHYNVRHPNEVSTDQYPFDKQLQDDVLHSNQVDEHSIELFDID